MRVAVSADERAPIVDAALAWLAAAGHEALYFGPAPGGEDQDWPVVTRAAAAAVARGEAEVGVVFCFTGTGASIAANKVPGVRAALCGDAETARGARKWNHANVVALSIRLTSPPLLGEILAAFFGEPLSEDDWNRRQIARLAALDRARAHD